MSGFSFSGVPGVVIGHNDRIAWGFTNLTTDVTDLYLEKIEGDQYWRDGALVPLDERTETIKVAGGDDVAAHDPLHRARSDHVGPDRGLRPRSPPTRYTGRRTVHGQRHPPIAPEGEYAVSLKWTALAARHHRGSHLRPERRAGLR